MSSDPAPFLQKLGAEDEDQSRDSNEPSSKGKILPMIACNICRRRKLKCDGVLPSCGRCLRLKHDCTYDERRRKSGPRRGYVKGLEDRLAQVEGLLKQQEFANPSTTGPTGSLGIHPAESDALFHSIGLDAVGSSSHPSGFAQAVQEKYSQMDFADVGIMDELSIPPMGSPPWEVINLGIEEPLPPQDIIDELTEIYFTKVHPSSPIIHQYRFLTAMSLTPVARPSISLRYAMWALAASITAKYTTLHSYFHTRARKYAETDESAGRQRYINLRHAQAWILIGIYEFKMMMFPNAWMTTGRATRITQMLGLHRLDGLGLDVKQTLPTPTDVCEKEERRRTFWMAFIMDRCSGVGTGWPLIVDERDVFTVLPSSEDNFNQSVSGPEISLNGALDPANATLMSSFGGCVMVASLTGQIMLHLHRPSNSNEEELAAREFWSTHRKINNTLLNMSLHLPAHLRLPAASSDPNSIYLNMTLQSAVICLHQAAIFKAQKLDSMQGVVEESKSRCLAAATELASIMMRIAHTDLSMLNVYTPFSLHLATRIFGQASKADPSNEQATSSMQFLLSALVAIQEFNPLAESYLIQLDLEDIGLAALQRNSKTLSDLAKSVAGISIEEDPEGSSWITFVSPLVRIVKRTEESTSSREMSQDFPGASPSSKNAKRDWKGKSKMPLETSFPGTIDNIEGNFSGGGRALTEPKNTFMPSETIEWDLDAMMQADQFDPLLYIGNEDCS